MEAKHKNSMTPYQGKGLGDLKILSIGQTVIIAVPVNQFEYQ